MMNWENLWFAAVFGIAASFFVIYLARGGWNAADLESKKEEAKVEICQRESKTAGEFERCLRVKE